MRVSKAWLVALIPLCCVAWVGNARACRMCDPFFHCIEAGMGAELCVEGPISCAILLPCQGGPMRFPDSYDGVTVWTLFDAVSASSPSLLPEAGPLVLGEEARAMSGGRAATGAIADLAIAFGGEFDVRLVNALGDGFALRRVVEGERVRLVVHELSGEQVGQLLASESLGARDQLTVPVRVEGRERVLVLQTTSAVGGRGASDVARLRKMLHAHGNTLPSRTKPLLEARAR